MEGVREREENGERSCVCVIKKTKAKEKEKRGIQKVEKKEDRRKRSRRR